MKLILESEHLEDYLKEIPPVVKFDTPMVSKYIAAILQMAPDKFSQAKTAFEIARDKIRHSFDTKFQPVMINAEETLVQSEGICFAKSHLLATLLRGLGIPAGFCYQRVLRKGDDPESGHALHGLNAIYLEEYGWFRVDPRGNKAGIDSQFNPETEQLAYPIRPELGEIDYPNVFTEPISEVLLAMADSETTADLFFNRPAVLPED